jgi:putative oxidoreductase
MNRVLGRYSEYVYAILRIVVGFLFVLHGTVKLFGVPILASGPIGALGTTAAVIELVAGLLIVFGFFASFAAFMASGEMAVAYFITHFKSEAPLPIQNGGELAVLYCFIFLYIAAKGSGVWSIDSLRGAPVAKL